MTYEQWKKEYLHASKAYDALYKSFDYAIDGEKGVPGSFYAQVSPTIDGFAMYVHRYGYGPQANIGDLSLNAMLALKTLHFIFTRYVRGEVAAPPDVDEWNESVETIK